MDLAQGAIPSCRVGLAEASKAGVVDSKGPVATERPSSLQDGLEPNSGLVLRPDFDLGVRMGTSDLQDLFA